MPLALLIHLLAAAPVPSSVTLEVGEMRRITVPNIQRIVVSGSDGYDVKPLGNDELALFGVAVGRGRLLGWKTTGERFVIELTIVPATVKKPKPVRLASKQVDGVTVVTLPDELADVVEAREADGGVLVIGRTKRGERVEVLLEPRVRSP